MMWQVRFDPGHAAAGLRLEALDQPVVHVRLGYVEVVADQLWLASALATAERKDLRSRVRPRAANARTVSS